MNLRYLESFLSLAEYNNFSEAADNLYISQSSLSKNIKKLEENIGTKLFLRTPTGTSLTKYGEIYYSYAKKINDLQKQCDKEINKSLSEEVALNIGGIPSISDYGILDLIIGFMNDTGIHCKITTNQSSMLEKELLNKQIDLAFIKNTESSDIKSVLYKRDQLVAVLPKDHPLATQNKIKISSLKNDDFIFEPVNSRPYNLCIALCKSEGFTPNVVYADRFIENIIEFIKKGFGVSLLMSSLVPKDDEIVKIPVIPNTLAKISLCYLEESLKNDLNRQFINYAIAKEH